MMKISNLPKDTKIVVDLHHRRESYQVQDDPQVQVTYTSYLESVSSKIVNVSLEAC
jgi:hypothetical protein